MSGIIDALVITLGLDARGYKKGADEARADIKKTRDQAGSAANDIEAYGKRAANFFGSLKSEVVGLFLAFAGANGLKDFVQQVITGEAATGRLATNIGMGTQSLSAWEEAIKTVGGEAKDADAALRTMSDAFQEWQQIGQTGHDAQFLALLGAQYRSIIAQGPEATLMALAEASQHMDRRRFANLAGQLGLSDPAINLLEKGRAGVEQLVDWEKKHGAATDEDAAAAQRMQDSWARLSSGLRGDARPAITNLANQMLGLLQIMGRLEALSESNAKGSNPVKRWIDNFQARLFGTPGNRTLAGHAVDWLGNALGIDWNKPLIGQGEAPIATPPQTLGGMVGSQRGAVALNGNNPGGIVDGPFARSQPGYAGANGRYARFDTLADGEAAQKALLASYVRRGYDTPAKIAARWAPAGDGGNNPSQYAATIARQLGIGVNDRITSDQISAFQYAQAIAENSQYARMARPGANAGVMSHATNATNITTGPITIYTPAANADVIARDLHGALKKRAMVAQANSGLSG